VDDQGAPTISIEFVRKDKLKDIGTGVGLTLPEITYAQVKRVTIYKPSWSSKIELTNPARHNLGDGYVTTELTGEEQLVSFTLVPTVPRLQRLLALIRDNFIWFSGTIIFGALLSFLAPPQAHHGVRVFLTLMAVLVALWLLLSIFSERVPGSLLSDAPVLAAESGLLVCVVFFERLDRLIQLLAAK
jgi:hypothetical protein